MNLTIIVAASENNVIGIGDKIPWKISEDMKRFKELTLGHPVIMGRKTYESIPPKFRPLPERKNIILSRTFKQKEGISVARSIEKALDFTGNKESYIIGGEIVYKAFLPLINKIELTRVHRNYEGNVFFPKINWENWNLILGELEFNK
ncbi:dihydrofolate reductase [Candidatus Pacearchaeota archaeon]|nr:dihydrofolate reductase [Candidatus Pacearchaeota archaeon]